MSAANAVVKMYHECTLEEEVDEAGAVTTMRKGAKDKTSTLYYKLTKMIALANPSFG